MSTLSTSALNNKNTAISGFNPAVAHKRRERDVMKLLMSDYKVVQSKESAYDFTVEFFGPVGSIYEGGKWEIHVILPDAYPYRSPSIGFNNKIYHPNVDETSGSVCLDVINQTWSPMFDLINIFDTFLPQLLLYPNPTDPLNPEAAAYMLKEPQKYEQKVKDHVKKYAKVEEAEEEVRNEETKEEEEETDMDIEDQEEAMSISGVSELSETSDIALMDE